MSSQAGTPTGADGGSTGNVWSNPTGAEAGSTFATCAPPSGQTSAPLKITFTGFSIPTGQFIVGFVVSFNRYADTGSPAISDASITLKAGGNSSGNLAAAGAWPLSAATAVYGSSGSVSGLSCTPADINGGGVELDVTVQTDAVMGTNTAHLNTAALTVYYSTTAPGDPFSGRNPWHNGSGGPAVQAATQAARVLLDASWQALAARRLLKYPLASPAGPAWPFAPVRPPRYRTPRDVPRARLITPSPPATFASFAAPRIVVVRLPHQYWIPDWC